MLTFRDDEVADDHPLRRLLGAGRATCAGSRSPGCPRTPCTQLADEVGLDGAAVLAATAGNPFFLAEVLANPGDTVPPTVADAVLARVTQLDPATRSRVEQLAVVVAPAARSLVEALPGGSAGLVAAERLGIVEFDGPQRGVPARPHPPGHRGEPARGRRIALHRLVLALLLASRSRTCPGWCTTRWRRATRR